MDAEEEGEGGARASSGSSHALYTRDSSRVHMATRYRRGHARLEATRDVARAYVAYGHARLKPL